MTQRLKSTSPELLVPDTPPTTDQDNATIGHTRNVDVTQRRALTVAAAMGFLAVTLGAFGAHGIKGWLSTMDDSALRLEWWQTATQYLFWHALLASVFAVMARRAPRAIGGVVLCAVGGVLFSGSLYVMTLTNVRVLGAVTPLGGLCFLAAWVWLLRCRPALR